MFYKNFYGIGILMNTPVVLVAGKLRAVFLPVLGMLCASLRYRGAELLGCIDHLGNAAQTGTMAGIPLMYPWANRLSGHRYHAAGREVDLDPSSTLLRTDRNGLPIHGVPWSLLRWKIAGVTRTTLSARLDWIKPDLLAIFPYPHFIAMHVDMSAACMTIHTTVTALGEGSVPVSFGFHPYVSLPDLPRGQWQLRLPAMRKLLLDSRGIPTGIGQAFAGVDAPLDALELDDGFILDGEEATLSIGGPRLRIDIDWLTGYSHAQVYAPRGRPYIALEPMTAPTNALVSGHGLRLVAPGGRFDAAFCIRVED